MYYISYGKFQDYLKKHFQRTGSGMQFQEMAKYLLDRGVLSEVEPKQVSYSRMFGNLSNEEFNRIVDEIILNISPNPKHDSFVGENDIIPDFRDVFIIRHPRYTRLSLHSHNYFEINYVAEGSCTMYFEDTRRIMNAGELCIIAPHSEHDLQILDDSTVFCIMLRKSTFETTFFSLLSRKDLLSYFFRTILQEKAHSNYLLFFIENGKWLNQIIHNAMAESYKNDTYSNISCISWMNLLFSYVLRNYSKTLQFYDYQMGTDFTLVLQYMQHNYKKITLSDLSKMFHYSESYLCTLFKQNTGHSFGTLLKTLRLSKAKDLLINTDLKIGEIAEKIGYNSADHFSRVFKTEHNISPLEYRKQNMGLSFTPFFNEAVPPDSSSA